uniref:Saposin B-type domain-containing protein n=1 Tax=Syphacia muris TaxID=451379 RepID=A0A0N5AMS2_9BILA
MLPLIILLQLINISVAVQNAGKEFIEVEIIQKSALCQFCKTIIDYHQRQIRMNPNYIVDLQKSCKRLNTDKTNEFKMCQSQFSDKRIQKLKTMSADDICVDEKICDKNSKQEPTIEPYRGKPDFNYIPDVDEEDRLNNGSSILEKIFNFNASKLTNDPENQITIDVNLVFKQNNEYVEGSGSN